MAKIDLSKITGYETMTAEEKISALEAYDFVIPTATPDYSGYIKKELFDKTASELAQLKKSTTQTIEGKVAELEQYKAQTAKDKADMDAEFASMKASLAQLQKEKAVAQHKAKYIGLGFDPDLAEKTACAFLDGDTDTVYANLSTVISSKVKNASESALESAVVQTPEPPAGKVDDRPDEDDYIKAFRDSFNSYGSFRRK